MKVLNSLFYVLCFTWDFNSYAEDIQIHPNTDACLMKKDLYDGPNYLKSMCLISGSFTYEESRQKCADNNMNAFIINDETVETNFFYASSYLLTAHPRGVLWINGKRSNGQWNVFNQDQTIKGSLFQNIVWANKDAYGDCLKYSSTNGPYRALPASCYDIHWGACEYNFQTEAPTFLDVSVCRNKKDLYVNGKYVKSMCIIETMDTYDEGRQRCARFGMNLFIVESAELEQTFYQYTSQFLIQHPHGHVWVNGMKDRRLNQWMVYDQNRQIKGPLFTELNWIKNGQTSGDCLRYAGQNGLYMPMGYSCDSRHWIVCEYNE